MKEIKKMKDEDLIKILKALRIELDKRRAKVLEKYTGIKYPMKNPLKKDLVVKSKDIRPELERVGHLGSGA